MKTIFRGTFFLLVGVSALQVVACSSKASFSSSPGVLAAGGGKVKPIEQDATQSRSAAAPTAAPVFTPRPDITFTQTPAPHSTSSGSTTSFSFSPQEVRSALNTKETWVVTDTSVTRIEIDEARGFPTQKWDIPSNAGSGNRTYVSEVGLLLGRTGNGANSGIYRVGPSVPSPGFQQIIGGDVLNMSASSRLCVTSFKAGEEAFIGGGFRTADNRVKFIKIPIDATKSQGVDVSRKQIFDLGSANDKNYWGYSCFVDQARGYFWFDAHDGGRVGVNVATGAPLSLDAIPNAGREGTDDISAFDIQPKTRGSYAMSGDGSGNVLSAVGSYTFAFDPLSQFVFGNQFGGSGLWVTHQSCFVSDRSCVANKKHFQFDTTSVGRIGPMSSLNDGSVVGVSRGNPSGVYLVSLKDKSRPDLGVNFRKIKEVAGDAYMYTDFTGATLYAAHVEKTFALDAAAGFRAGRPVVEPKILWTALSGAAEPWIGLKLQYRCYLASDSSKPALKMLAAVGSANSETALDCSGLFDRIDIVIDGMGSTSGFSRTASFQVSGKQN